MITPIPFLDLELTARCFDDAMLEELRLTNFLILDEITHPHKKSEIKEHPCVLMWRGHQDTLLAYQTLICNEWTDRGYPDEYLHKSMIITNNDYIVRYWDTPWMNDPAFRLSSQAFLMRQNPAHYCVNEWDVDITIPIYWPTENGYTPQKYFFHRASSTDPAARRKQIMNEVTEHNTQQGLQTRGPNQ